ncbi:MAG: M55 family metallopeptidase [Trueperaceae bacterium]|nr:M55 family metallopeptidase [Trueperaceae bacterium]
MRVYISSDIEGVAGVVDWGHSIPGAPEYGRARRLMTAEVNAAAAAAFAAGAESVVVNDSHGPMNNILIEELNERVELVTGRPKALTMVHGVGDGFDVAMFLGYHAKAGTAGGVLEHSYSGICVFDITLNGRSYGEFGLNTMMAGYHGVPVVLASGDQKLAAEVADVNPHTETVVVKQAVSRFAARSLTPKVAHERIADAVTRVLSQGPDVWKRALLPPLAGELTLDLTFLHTYQADAAGEVPDVERVGGRTLRVVGSDYQDVYNLMRLLIGIAGSVTKAP